MRALRVVTRLPYLLWFVVVFLYELAVANARLAWDVLTPGLPLTPAIVRVPTNTRTDLEMLLLANTITMTPGTLSLEVDHHRRDLYVHTLYYEDRERFIADIQKLERVLLKALR